MASVTITPEQAAGLAELAKKHGATAIRIRPALGETAKADTLRASLYTSHASWWDVLMQRDGAAFQVNSDRPSSIIMPPVDL